MEVLFKRLIVRKGSRQDHVKCCKNGANPVLFGSDRSG